MKNKDKNSIRPGNIIKKYTSKKGRKIVLRFPKEDDVDLFYNFSSELLQEDTFITMTDEKILCEEFMFIKNCQN